MELTIGSGYLTGQRLGQLEADGGRQNFIVADLKGAHTKRLRAVTGTRKHFQAHCFDPFGLHVIDRDQRYRHTGLSRRDRHRARKVDVVDAIGRGA